MMMRLSHTKAGLAGVHSIKWLTLVKKQQATTVGHRFDEASTKIRLVMLKVIR